MTFKYRLERVLSLREQELDKVKARFQEANANLRKIENSIQENKSSQLQTQSDMSTPLGLTSPSLYANRLKYLKQKQEILEQELEEANKQLEQIKQELLEAQQKMEALKKHKKKQKLAYEKEELRKEEVMLNELALTMRRIKEDNENTD